VRGHDGGTLGRAQTIRAPSVDEVGALQLQNLGYDREIVSLLKAEQVAAKAEIRGRLLPAIGGS
jgi:hypothetical protein